MAHKHPTLVHARRPPPVRAFVRECRVLLVVLAVAAGAGAAAAGPLPLRFALAGPVTVAQAAATPTATVTATTTATSATAATAKVPASAPAPAAVASAAACTPVVDKAQLCTGAASNLQLAVVSAALPAGKVGAAYKQRVVLGGVSGYTISVLDGSLPPGLTTTVDGDLLGTPTKAGLSRFTLKVVDHGSPPASAQQAYTLRVTGGPAGAPARAASAPASAPRTPTAVALSAQQSDAFARGRAGPGVSVYRLTLADIDAIAPEAPPPPAPEPGAQAATPAESLPAGTQTMVTKDGVVIESQEVADAKAEAAAAAAEAARLLQLRQLRQILLPLQDVEYPSRALFESAVDWQLRAFVSQLAAQAAVPPAAPPPAAASARGAQPPAKAASASRVASAPAPAASASVPAAASPTVVVVPIADLPAYLLPDATRVLVITKAEKPYEISKAPAIDWNGGSCGCVHEDLLGDVYGFYPFWAAGVPQEVDFSLLKRIGYAALPFDDDGNVQAPGSWDAANANFVQVAQRHGTHLDLIVYRNDWRRLLAQDDARLERVAGELARSAVRAANVPLQDRASRLQRFVPFYWQRPLMADGITLFFDNFPAAGDGADARRFSLFFNKLMQALIGELHQGGRTFALNIAVSDRQIGAAPFDYPTLFGYIKLAEKPLVENDRIQDESDQYKSRTNVTLKFLVLLSEPTSQSKKVLRKAVEDAPGIYGNDRRVLLRKVIAAISYNGDHGDRDAAQQFRDDLAYFRDNFGGVGLWRVPVAGEPAGAAQYEAINNAMRKDGTREVNATCNFVCTNRWLARAAFSVLLLGDLVAIVLIAVAGGLRCLSRPTLGAMLVCALLTGVVGGGLLNCDPELRSWREGNTLLWFSLAAAGLAAVYAIVRPRDVPP